MLMMLEEKVLQPHSDTLASLSALASLGPSVCGGSSCPAMAPPVIQVRFLGTSTTPVPTRNYSRYAYALTQPAGQNR